MATPRHPPESLDFLAKDPVPVSGGAAALAGTDRLPQAVIDSVMALPGVDGMWIEADADGQRVVVIHYTPRRGAAKLPSRVHGLPTRIVGGRPIRAL